MEIRIRLKEILIKYKQAFIAFVFMFPFLVLGNYLMKEIDRYKDYIKHRHQFIQIEQDQVYVLQASKIVDYYYRQNVPVRFSVVKETLEQIDYFLPIYFPDGPFTARDFIAMAMIESEFNQYLVGKAGEKGIFQIMEESSKWMDVKKNQFDISVNVELSMFVLREKFKKHQEYRKSIIAYNGVIVGSNGKWVETYWKRFYKARTDVDIMLKNIK